jgi:hypothetical protein
VNVVARGSSSKRARRVAWFIAVVISPATAWAQPARQADLASPAPPARAATVEAFAPAGWTIEQQHAADFNSDGSSDVLLLIRDRAGAGVTPRRILLLALASGTAPRYTLLASSDRLIPRDTTGTIEDPMADGEITLRPRGFELKIGYVAGAGSYQAASMRFRFRVEASCVRLIGYDRNETHRGTLETSDLSVNFLTGTVVRAKGNAQSGAARRQRSRLTTNPRRCLQDLPSGWTFDPLARRPGTAAAR